MLIALGLGLVVGVILALTGAGGGILAVPLLVFGLHMGLAQAGPIGLLAVGMAATLGAILGLRDGVVRYRAALLVAGSGMLFSPLGLWIAQRIDNRWLSVVFAFTLLFVAGKTLHQARGKAPAPAAPEQDVYPCTRDSEGGRFIWTGACARALILSGTVAGLLSGLLGVGGGFVMVPALQRYTNLDMRAVVATSLAVIALVSMAGVAVSAASGGMDWVVALPFSGGALAGMLAGKMIATRLAGRHLQRGFAAVAGIVAIAMLGRALL